MAGYKLFRAQTQTEDGTLIDPREFNYEETFLNGDVPFTVDTMEAAEHLLITLQEKDNTGYYKIVEVSREKKTKKTPTTTKKAVVRKKKAE